MSLEQYLKKARMSLQIILPHQKNSNQLSKQLRIATWNTGQKVTASFPTRIIQLS